MTRYDTRIPPPTWVISSDDSNNSLVPFNYFDGVPEKLFVIADESGRD